VATNNAAGEKYVDALIRLPYGLVAGAQYSDGAWRASPGALRIPTIGYIVIFGFFIILPAIAKRIFFSGIILVLYLLFLSVNL